MLRLAKEKIKDLLELDEMSVVKVLSKLKSLILSIVMLTVRYLLA